MKIALGLVAAVSSATTAFVVQTPTTQHSSALSAGPVKMPFADRATSVGDERAVSGPLAAPPTEPDMQVANNVDTPQQVKVQGGALRTWTTQSPEVERMLISMRTEGPPEGNPLLALVELNQGPDNTPLKMKIKSGKGNLRPIRAVVETPGGGHSLFIRNLEAIEFPIQAKVMGATDDVVSKDIHEMTSPKLLQGGGAVTSYPLDPNVNVAKVQLNTDGRPLNAAIELTQGPNAVKVLIELYSEDGVDWPFYTLIETPGTENTIRVWSTGTVEFPLTVCVEPFLVHEGASNKDNYFTLNE